MEEKRKKENNCKRLKKATETSNRIKEKLKAQKWKEMYEVRG